MRLKTLLTLSLAAITLAATAAPISPDEALRRAGKTGTHSTAARAAAQKQPRLVHTLNTSTGDPAAYVFNAAGTDAGYLVLSADDMAYPILGYADEGTFDAASIPPQMQWWLEQYSNQIDHARNHQAATTSDKTPFDITLDREAIPPMISTLWDQGSPFNGGCPLYGTDRTYTGCVATSMAQVMNYWQHPARGKGTISYTSATIEKKLSLNLAMKAFDWDHMKQTYYDGYTAQDSAAVAYLMKAAGYSVKMDYSTNASGALAMDISNALIKYFDYDPNMLYTIRDYYTSAQWDEMIYKNLKEVGPILYGGGTYIGGGHSFVLDGYDGQGFYHFNWGWSGMSNGYFSLQALTPDALGAGGGGGGGYTFSQDAIFGIQPPTGKPAEDRPLEMTQTGTLTGSISAGKLTLDIDHSGEAMWVNYNAKTQKIGFGAIIEPQGTTNGLNKYVEFGTRRYEIPGGYGTGPKIVNPVITLADLDLADGTYKVTMATFDAPTASAAAPDGSEWRPVRTAYGYYNYVTLTKKDNTYTVVNGQIPQLKIKGELISSLYYGGCSRWRVTVENTSDIEATTGLAPCLADETLGPLFLGESIFLVIPPHETVTREWDTTLTQLQQKSISTNTTLGFTFFNEYDYIYYDDLFLDEVVMYPSPGAPDISLSVEPKIVGSTIDEVSGFIRYTITDPLKIELSARVRLEKGIFQSNMMACICSQGENGAVNIETYGGQPMYMSTTGAIGRFNTTLSYPVMKPGVNYYLLFAYETPQGLAQFSKIGAFMITWPGDQSGIDNITGDTTDGSPIEVYNLQGIKLGDTTDGLAPGIYIIRQGDTIKKIRL